MKGSMPRKIKINFIGNFSSTMTGEVGDETHLLKELRDYGHDVRECPRDIWAAIVEGHTNPDWEGRRPLGPVDINIVCKWDHFNDPVYFRELRKITGAPVVFWVWDYFDYDGGPHTQMARAADLFLTNEGEKMQEMKERGIHPYYFPFDVVDKQFHRVQFTIKRDVAFFGSFFGKGDRVEWLTEINKEIPITIFSSNHEKWTEKGFKAFPAVYGQDFANEVSKTKIVLGFNVNDHCWGYWSNRVGKVMVAGGFLLQRYVPGMELFLRDGAEYFSSVKEAMDKIRYYCDHDLERMLIQQKACDIGYSRLTSKARIVDLSILLDRYLAGAI